jgi:hypothetical protein
MKAELKEKWIAELRSGKYAQGRMYLVNSLNQYCCLGVLCKVVGHDDDTMKTEWTCGGRYPTFVQSLLSQGDSYQLTVLNDGGKTFDEIADYIEAKL